LASYPYYSSVPYEAAVSTAAVIVFQRALELAGTLDPQTVGDTLAGLEIDTFFGHIAFDTRGVNSSKPMAVEQLHPDGRIYTVFPSDVAEKAALYSMPPWSQR
jgi:branched-chain amino acid transport system substrate-binding protein